MSGGLLDPAPFVDLAVLSSTGADTPSLRSINDEAEAERIAQEFESVFLAQMLAHMFQGVKADGPFGGGSAERTFQPMLYDEYAKTFTRAGGIGIADQLKAELLRYQDVDMETTP